jgi:MscS family membrane protein
MSRRSAHCPREVTVLSYRPAYRAHAFGACIASLLLLSAAPLQAQPKGGAPSAKPAAPPDSDATSEQPPEDSPRSTLAQFFEFSRAGNYAEAAKYLELSPADAARGPLLAARLRLVLERFAWIDLSTVSAAVGGDADDGMGQGTEQVAQIPTDGGVFEPVRLVRRGPAEARWLFSRVTVRRIDGWYDRLPHRWLLELAPEPLLRLGPLNLLWAQWIVLPMFLIAVWMIAQALSRGGRRLARPLVKRTAASWGEPLLRNLAGSLTTSIGLIAAYALTPWLGLYAPALNLVHRAIRGLLFATFFWALARSVDVSGQILAESQWGRGAPGTRALLLFGSRVGKFFVAALALVALFSEFGYPVTSLIAGLGVGGIAVALAAQKSLENLIGAFAIAMDQPFREGDFVRIDNFVGTVEVIGMRSTRIRTLDRTLISIPNGKLADMRLETFAARDRVRLGFTFGLTYATTEAQMRQILTGFERLLRGHEKIWPEGSAVRFKEFGESALLIEVGCWFATADFDAFTLIRQDLLLQFMAIVERAGARFAFPTRTLQMVGQPQLTTPSNG